MPDEQTEKKQVRAYNSSKTWRIEGIDRNRAQVKEWICNTLEYSSYSLRGMLLSFEGTPKRELVVGWLKKDDDFAANYARVRTTMADYLAEEILDIVDDSTNDYMEDKSKNGEETGGYKFMGEHVQRSKLRVDTRKWLMAKAMPKKYGEVIKLEVDNIAYGERSLQDLRQMAADYVQLKGQQRKKIEMDSDVD